MHKRNANNNDAFPPLNYSRSYFTQWLLKDTSGDGLLGPQSSNPSTSKKSPSPSHNHKRNNMELIQLLAINALEFTAPVYSFLNKAEPSTSEKEKKEILTKKTSTELKLEREFIQLSGHPGSFAPAGPNSLWKKMPSDSHQEAVIYTKLKSLPQDPFAQLLPHFISHTSYNKTDFIELEDLITRFDLKTLSIMDMKLGTRTFLESEVLNIKPRTDLFDKMYKIDSKAFTEEELANKSVTKLRYMQFREKLSSTNDLGFRIEGVKLHNEHLDINFQRLKDESSISSILHKFCGKYRQEFKEKLKFIRECVETSAFVAYHEFVGCSVLMIQDERQCGCWIIDFAKTFESDKPLNHRRPWSLGNREDGLLTGLDNIIRLIE